MKTIKVLTILAVLAITSIALTSAATALTATKVQVNGYYSSRAVMDTNMPERIYFVYDVFNPDGTYTVTYTNSSGTAITATVPKSPNVTFSSDGVTILNINVGSDTVNVDSTTSVVNEPDTVVHTYDQGAMSNNVASITNLSYNVYNTFQGPMSNEIATRNADGTYTVSYGQSIADCFVS